MGCGGLEYSYTPAGVADHEKDALALTGKRDRRATWARSSANIPSGTYTSKSTGKAMARTSMSSTAGEAAGHGTCATA